MVLQISKVLIFILAQRRAMSFFTENPCIFTAVVDALHIVLAILYHAFHIVLTIIYQLLTSVLLPYPCQSIAICIPCWYFLRLNRRTTFFCTVTTGTTLRQLASSKSSSHFATRAKDLYQQPLKCMPYKQ